MLETDRSTSGLSRSRLSSPCLRMPTEGGTQQATAARSIPPRPTLSQGGTRRSATGRRRFPSSWDRRRKASFPAGTGRTSSSEPTPSASPTRWGPYPSCQWPDRRPWVRLGKSTPAVPIYLTTSIGYTLQD